MASTCRLLQKLFLSWNAMRSDVGNDIRRRERGRLSLKGRWKQNKFLNVCKGTNFNKKDFASFLFCNSNVYGHFFKLGKNMWEQIRMSLK